MMWQRCWLYVQFHGLNQGLEFEGLLMAGLGATATHSCIIAGSMPLAFPTGENVREGIIIQHLEAYSCERNPKDRMKHEVEDRSLSSEACCGNTD